MDWDASGSERWKTAVALGVLVILLVFLYWLQTVVLLACLGLLFGIFLDAIARPAMRYLKLPRGVAVVIATVLFLGGLAATLFLLAFPVMRELAAFLQAFPEQMKIISHDIEHYRQEYPWLKHILPEVGLGASAGTPGPSAALNLAKTAFFTASSALEWGARLVATFFLGIFLAWDPTRWVRGVAGLWPRPGLEKRVELLRRISSAMRNYLFTLIISMFTMGFLWALGLYVIGISYPLLFGAIGGLVEIVPYLGPLVGLIPPLLFAIGQEPVKILSVIILYGLLHIFEGYLLVPYVLHRREHLPPPLAVLSILAFGTIFGPLGVILAVPLGMVGYVWANEVIYARGGKHQE